MVVIWVRRLAVAFFAGCLALIGVVGARPAAAIADVADLVARDVQTEAQPGQPFQPRVVVDNTGDTAVDGFTLFLWGGKTHPGSPSPSCRPLVVGEAMYLACDVDAHLDPGERYEGMPFKLIAYGLTTMHYGVYVDVSSLSHAATITINFLPPPPATSACPATPCRERSAKPSR